ncbi:MAG: hypothetical protein RLZZ58_1134 [Pseudomonadota bacterium]
MKKQLLIGVLLLATAMPLAAQDNGNLGEVIVTASRNSVDFYQDEQPVIGLRRRADSAVQLVAVTSDSRDFAMRKQEIHAMLESAIKRAGAAGVQLVTGEVTLEPMTLANYRERLFEPGNRTDTNQVSFYVKVPLGQDSTINNAQDRIEAFIKGVPASGRSLLEKRQDMTLTIIDPDQYRDAVVKLVAAESLKYAGMFGPDYGVTVSGLHQELSWAQTSGTEVFLYIPYSFSILPK